VQQLFCSCDAAAWVLCHTWWSVAPARMLCRKWLERGVYHSMSLDEWISHQAEFISARFWLVLLV
jgi:hypothetical protein